MNKTAAHLSPARVEAIFVDCLFRDGEPTDNHVKAEGIVRNVGFHPERLAGHKQETASLLDELPDDFKKSGGGGMSFLNACVDKHGHQWTGEHRIMEQLFQLGIGTGLAHSLMPRDLWSVMPGGMPYFVVG